ncbi:MAG: hypothetical protein K2Q22_04555 [Cytophagales bacterium]|nr:hypothetical protein [Cytophagales bacterium]
MNKFPRNLIASVFLGAILLVFPVFAGTEGYQNKVNLLLKYDYRIKNVMLSESKVLRGFDFGTSYALLRQKEKGLFVAEGSKFCLYQIKVGAKEQADVFYYIDDKKNVSGFAIAMVFKNGKEMNKLFKSFSDYLSERFGKFYINERGHREWKTTKGYFIELAENYGEESVGLEVEFFKQRSNFLSDL